MSEISREEHIKWCKERAHKELEHSWISAAVSSIISDLSKHPETEWSVRLASMLMITVKDKASAILFIDGFN